MLRLNGPYKVPIRGWSMALTWTKEVLSNVEMGGGIFPGKVATFAICVGNDSFN